jgi:prepilin-type N-terminal cleavage/methylation domain-containing protein
MRNLSREDGFTLTEMLVSTTVVLLVLGGALTTFKNALAINDSAAQLADANQNLRAGTNQLVRDILMAGRIIGTEGIAMPTGPSITFARPGPTALNFDLINDGDPTFQLPSITTGYHLGPIINNSQSACPTCTPTDIITIMTVDEFMPVVSTPPQAAGAPTATEGTLSADGTNVTLATNSQWLVGDTVNDTPKIKVGDLVLYVGTTGNAIQTVTSIDATHIFFAAGDTTNDFFHFNQPNATNQVAGTGRPLFALKGLPAASAWPAAAPVTLFKALMITYYVDNTTTPGTPRLTRVVNHFTPQALAGVVEDIDLTYDLYDGVTNPTNVTSLPYTVGAVTYTSSQIRKVNVHVGVRSEIMSKPLQDYVRNHITTSVNVRSLAAVDKYPS